MTNLNARKNQFSKPGFKACKYFMPSIDKANTMSMTETWCKNEIKNCVEIVLINLIPNDQIKYRLHTAYKVLKRKQFLLQISNSGRNHACTQYMWNRDKICSYCKKSFKNYNCDA